MYNMSIHLAFCLIKSTRFKDFRRNFRTKIIEKPCTYAVCRLLSYYNTRIYSSHNSSCFHIYKISLFTNSRVILLFAKQGDLYRMTRLFRGYPFRARMICLHIWFSGYASAIIRALAYKLLSFFNIA